MGSRPLAFHVLLLALLKETQPNQDFSYSNETYLAYLLDTKSKYGKTMAENLFHSEAP
jgi:hypothetical protein